MPVQKLAVQLGRRSYISRGFLTYMEAYDWRIWPLISTIPRAHGLRWDYCGIDFRIQARIESTVNLMSEFICTFVSLQFKTDTFQHTKMVHMDPFFLTQPNFFWDDAFPFGSCGELWHSVCSESGDNIVLEIFISCSSSINSGFMKKSLSVVTFQKTTSIKQAPSKIHSIMWSAIFLFSLSSQ